MITLSKSSKSSNKFFFAKNHVANYGNFGVQICCGSKRFFCCKSLWSLWVTDLVLRGQVLLMEMSPNKEDG